MRSPLARFALVGLPVAAFLLPLSAAAALEYERDIMPIFEQKCYDCHSAKAEKLKGGLAFDDPRGFFQRFQKNEVVIPGDWDASYLFVVIIRPPDHKEAMPPKDKGEALTPAEIVKVATWIHEGARIDGEKGGNGAKEDDPAVAIMFKDGRIVTEAFEAPAAGQAEEWVNRDGRKIVAVYKGLESGNAILVLKDGRTFRYPLEKLSDGSVAKIRALAGRQEEPAK